MSFLRRVEDWCAQLVEQNFARAFPGPLEPAHAARKLVAEIDRSVQPPGAARPSRYTVLVSPADFAALDGEKAALERQWSRMAAALCERAAGSVRVTPIVALAADPSLARGSVHVAVEHAPQTGAGPLVLRIERGVEPGKSLNLPSDTSDRAVVVGRELGCDLVVSDARVSRRHVRIAAGARGVEFEDLGSSNGTLCNGELLARGRLSAGDRLELGDTTLFVDLAEVAT